MLEIIIRGTSGSGKSALALLIQHYIRGDVPVRVIDANGGQEWTTAQARTIVRALPREQIAIATENVPKSLFTTSLIDSDKGEQST